MVISPVAGPRQLLCSACTWWEKERTEIHHVAKIFKAQYWTKPQIFMKACELTTLLKLATYYSYLRVVFAKVSPFQFAPSRLPKSDVTVMAQASS